MRVILFATLFCMLAVSSTFAHTGEEWFILCETENSSAERRLCDDYKDGLSAHNANDYKTAHKLWLPLAELGHAKAQYFIGRMYENGEGVSKSIEDAVKWYVLATKHDDHNVIVVASARLDLFDLAEKGISEALIFTINTAKSGDSFAQYILGLLYKKGEGVPQNNQMAVRWFRHSAEQGYSGGQEQLSLMYFNGEGVPQDYVLAHMWCNLSGSSEDRFHVINRSIIEKKMTPSQIAEAQKLARNWKPKAK